MTDNVYRNKPWTNSYKLGPYKLEAEPKVPNIPLYQILDDSAHNYPDKVAIYFQDWVIRYQELKSTVDRLAAGLVDLGLKKGDRVAIVLPMSPQIIICAFAIWKAGGVTLLTSPLARPQEIEYELGEAEAEVIICLDEAEPRIASFNSIKEFKGNIKIKDVLITSRKDFSPEEESEIRELPGTINIRRLISESASEPPIIDIDPVEDMAILMFTGGTTGVPKGVMHTHFSMMATTVLGFPWVLKPLQEGIWGKASLLVTLPLYHAAGMWAALQSIYMGLRTIIVPDPRDTMNIVNLVKAHRPMMILATPTQLMRLVQMKVGKLPSLVISTGAPLPLEIAQAWKKETGVPIAQGYGASEGGILLNISSFSKLTGFIPVAKAGIGVPSPCTDVKIVDHETDEELPVDEVGEICLSGANIMKGYWPTAGSGLKEGWLYTGDLGRMDKDGYFYLEDRIKDMINVSGLKVYSVQVEEVLFKHPAVGMAIVIGIPDPERPGSERVKAFIKLKEVYEGEITAEEIIALCKEQLPPYAVPKFVEFRENLPISGVEKLLKRTLRDEEIEKMKGIK